MTKTQRAVTLILAILFLITSVGFTILVITEMGREDEQPTTATETSNQSQGEKLQGTKLEGFTPVENVESLQIIDLEEGTGEAVPEGATVTAHYTGAIASTGVIFQSSHDLGQAVPFSLNGVIEGWTKGVPGMKIGGKRRLLIPAEQAYGEQSPSPDIPANSDLVFDIEIISIDG